MFEPNKFGYLEEAGAEEGGAVSHGDGQSNADVVADSVNADWKWSDNTPGEGAAPEWLKGDKYKTVEAQAKAYTELEGKFGAFTGAPEDYEIKVSDDLKEKGFDVDPEDPVVQEFTKWAKESNLSQEGYNGLLELKGMMDAAQEQAFNDQVADELNKLGKEGQARINNINAWANANMAPDMVEKFQGLATSADSVEALEALIAKTRNAPISSESLAPAASVSSQELKDMQFAKDERGNRKMQDPEYRARFNKLAQEVYGADPARQTIG